MLPNAHVSVPTLSRSIFFVIAIWVLATGVARADKLDEVLAAQPAEVQARYAARHPRETLDFFGIAPGMTVVEVFPGDGWYTRILAAYLGTQGKLVGADYAAEMYPKFNFYDAAFLKTKQTWVTDWPRNASAWATDDAEISGFALGSMPKAQAGSADAVLMIRAFHNLARFERDGAYMSRALADIARVLKPGGVVGIVQHRAPDDADDAWADGSKGYLKQAFVVASMQAAGFEHVGASEVNRNPRDRPTTADMVWRLPPTFSGAEGDAARAAMAAIGESDRMTLLFRKPKP